MTERQEFKDQSNTQETSTFNVHESNPISSAVNNEYKNFIRETVPDRFPTKEDLKGVDKVEDYLHVEYPANQDGELVMVKVERDRYPRSIQLRGASGRFTKDVLDVGFAITIGDSPPYFVNNHRILFAGEDVTEEKHKFLKDQLQVLREGVEDRSIKPIVKVFDNDMNSDTLGQMIPVEDAA